MLLIFLLIVPIILWLIPLSGLSSGRRIIAKSFLINFVSMLILAVLAAAVMWLFGMNFVSVMVVLLSISTCWGAIFHLIGKGRNL